MLDNLNKFEADYFKREILILAIGNLVGNIISKY